MKSEAKAGGWTPPDSFEEYRLVRFLGGGAMGRVYLAHDLLLDRQVAIKFVAQLDLSIAARERFFREARAVARLKHPNVVAVHRVGTVLGRPYLVSEYLEGRSLDHLDVRPRGARLIDIAVGLARGLAAAHRAGVLHRDVKPANAMLTSDGEVKLLDFGLAKLHGPEGAPPVEGPQRAPSARPALAAGDLTITDSGSFEPPSGESDSEHSMKGRWVGTPRYMAPEVWRFEEPTVASDVYSMGALLFELAAGVAPHTATTGAELAESVQRGARSLDDALPGVDARFAAIVDRCLALDPASRYAHADALREALEALATPLAPAAPVPGNPYRGLHAFQAEHRAVFFGRATETRAVLERLRSQSFVVVVGSSGAGKSSLCRAGVLPLVEAGALGRGAWRSVALTPGAQPVAALAAALAPFLEVGAAEAERQLRDEPRAVARALTRGEGLIVLVDQLEELVTLAPPDEAAAAARAIEALAERIPSVAVVATVRSDFLAQVADLPDLGSTLVPALYMLGPLSPEGLREAIVGPAAAHGVRFASDEMVDALARGAGVSSGGLPLLQFALAELWEAREGDVIPEAALARMGGVEGALAGHADRVVAALGPADRTAARQVLLRLVSDEGTRARLPMAEVVAGDAGRQRALEALIRGRLVVATDAPGENGSTCELAHEALLVGWPTLAGWVSGDVVARAAHDRLRQAARDWARLGRSTEALWLRRQLEEAAVVDAAALAPLEAEFLGASRRHVTWSRARGWIGALALVVLIAGLWAGFRVQAQRERGRTVADKLAAAQIDVGQAAASEARARDQRARSAAAYDAGKQTEGAELWRAAETDTAAADRAYGDAASALESALELAPDDARLRAAYANLLLARALWAETAGEDHQQAELLRRLERYDDDGSRRRTLARPAALDVRAPEGARLQLHAYRDRRGRLEPEAIPLTAEVAAGSYLLVAETPGRATVRVPFAASRGESVSIDVQAPLAAAVPRGFLYVPAGTFLAGSDDDESVRTWLRAPPMHPARTEAFLVGEHEVTWAEWIKFLEALPADERARRTPAAGGLTEQYVRLERDARGWLLRMRPTVTEFTVRPGERVRYPGRDRNGSQDWLRMPVTGVSYDDATAYARWRDARLCSFHEWERAARGADGRRFPSGNVLRPEDANYDLTYGTAFEARGPDEVGIHGGDSPFGAADMAGNVWEWVDLAGAPTLRGGCYYHYDGNNRADNQEPGTADLRATIVGFRLCKDAPR